MSQLRNVCFTVFGFDEGWESESGKQRYDEVTEALKGWQAVTYCVMGKEICPDTGRLHLQGYMELDSPKKLSTLQNLLPGVHFERRKKTAEQAANYCKKDGDFTEWGELKKQGKRTDLTEFMDAVKDGKKKRQLIEDHPAVFARYNKFANDYIQIVKEDNVEKITEFEPMYPWQQEILDILAQPADPRTIVWVYDAWGNSGKTYLARYLVDSKDAFYTNGGKGTDICYAFDYEKIVIFDYVRDSVDWVNYGVIEQLKNGVLTSNKYESKTKRFETPHVLVFANFKYSPGKFSEDRMKLIELNQAHQMI